MGFLSSELNRRLINNNGEILCGRGNQGVQLEVERTLVERLELRQGNGKKAICHPILFQNVFRIPKFTCW